MAVRDPATVQRQRSSSSSIVGRLTRYDLVLLIIPVAFLFALVAVHALSLSMQTAIVGASIVGALAVVDGLFVNPPRPR